jgi:hypothetical protein
VSLVCSIGEMKKWLASLTILVAATLFIGGCTPPNQPPVISSLTASAGRLIPAQNCEVKCVASDPDGDKLNYTWSASGEIFGEGATISWTAPAAPSEYTISVKVTDGRGGEATAELTIGVAVNHSPVIDSLTAERQKVKKAMTSTIECTASDPDGDKLSYTWSTSGGSISGEGSAVSWVAPNTFGTYTITVTVTDGRGGQATQSIEIVVTCCL